MDSSLSWEWKREPVSPPQIYEDTWLFDDNDSQAAGDLTSSKFTIVKHEHEVTYTENKAEVVSKLLEDLDNLDNLDYFMKEEPFSNWLEEKVDLPIFEDIPIEPARGYPIQPTPRYKTEELKPIPLLPQHQHVQPQPQDTSVLLQEFETVYDAVEMTHGQLTPPQSPPLAERQVLTTLTPLNTVPINFVQPVQPAAVYYQPIQPIPGRNAPVLVPHPNHVDLQPGTPQPDVAHELAVVEELVRSRAENMVESWEGCSSNSTIRAPSSPSSSSCSGFSEYSSDPEWIPEPVNTSNGLVEKPSRGRKRAGKPYSRVGPEDKKSRKKEQNKNAATRYRMKKKAEIEEILGEEKQLMDSNDDLQNKVTDLQREIKYLKGLMRDLFKAKGLIQ